MILASSCVGLSFTSSITFLPQIETESSTLPSLSKFRHCKPNNHHRTSRSSAHPTSTMASRFMLLPTEIRPSIYQFTFSSNSSSDSSRDNDILKIKNVYPPAALLSVCRQIHNEAIAEHESAVQDFWTNTTFALYLDKAFTSRAHRCDIVQRLRSMTKLHAQRINPFNIVWKDVTLQNDELVGRAASYSICIKYDSLTKWLVVTRDDHARYYRDRKLMRLSANLLLSRDLVKSGGGGLDVVSCVMKCFEVFNGFSDRGRGWPHIP